MSAEIFAEIALEEARSSDAQESRNNSNANSNNTHNGPGIGRTPRGRPW